jgi:hypothetical protein
MSAARLWPLASLVTLVGAVLGVACAAPAPRAPACPSGTFCGTVPDVEAMRQTPEGALRCPKYVAWGQDGGPPPAAAVGSPGEGSLDLDLTRKRRADGATEACCYHWYVPCPLADGGPPGP